MSHTITLSRPFYSPIQELNYAYYKNKYYALRLDNVWERHFFICSNKLLTRELCTPKFMEISITVFGNWFLDYFIDILGENGIPEYIKIYAMQHGGEYLWLFQHPSNDVIDAALMSAGQSIVHVPNPTKHQKLLGVKYSTETPDLITKIKKPTVQMKIIHVSKYIDGIDYIKNPSESVKIAAAKAWGTIVLKQKNMRNASEQVLLTAISYTLSTELDCYLKYIPHPNQKIMCAIRHQINMTKAGQKQWESERTNTPRQRSCKNELDFLRRALMGFGHLEEAVRIENKYYRDAAAQIKALTTLYKQVRTNPFIECHNQEILHPQRS